MLKSADQIRLPVIILVFLWVYWDQLDANCLVLFYYTFFTLHISDVIYMHPQERHIMHMQSDTGKCTCELTRSTPFLASNSCCRPSAGNIVGALYHKL